eukprot:IDg8751t1
MPRYEPPARMRSVIASRTAGSIRPPLDLAACASSRSRCACNCCTSSKKTDDEYDARKARCVCYGGGADDGGVESRAVDEEQLGSRRSTPSRVTAPEIASVVVVASIPPWRVLNRLSVQTDLQKSARRRTENCSR